MDEESEEEEEDGQVEYVEVRCLYESEYVAELFLPTDPRRVVFEKNRTLMRTRATLRTLATSAATSLKTTRTTTTKRATKTPRRVTRTATKPATTGRTPRRRPRSGRSRRRAPRGRKSPRRNVSLGRPVAMEMMGGALMLTNLYVFFDRRWAVRRDRVRGRERDGVGRQRRLVDTCCAGSQSRPVRFVFVLSISIQYNCYTT